MAELQVQGSTPPLPLSLADCRDAAVVRGTVVACTASADGSPSCRAFGAGEAIDAHGLGVGASVRGLEGLQRLLRAVPGQPTGVPRGAETLLPSKVVLLLDQVVLVDFAEADMQGVEAVEFHRDSVDGPLTARIDRAPGPTSIPGDAFVAGPYYWAVPVPGERPNQAPRRFTVAPERERQDAIDRLRVFDRQQAGPLATTMMRAAWLAQQNYDYDALATMKAVGLRTR
ncbi:MAG TPA: hypothetical protein VF319_18585 [Caldimonas sp.]